METRGGCRSLPKAEFPPSVPCCSVSAGAAEGLSGDKGTESFTATTPGEGKQRDRKTCFTLDHILSLKIMSTNLKVDLLSKRFPGF